MGESSDLKYKKLYFHDISYQVMHEKNIYFTTSDLIQNDQITLLNNQDRSVQTGIAIKELIKKIFPEEENYKVKFSEFWDQGGSSIFYSSPAQSKAIEVMKAQYKQLHLSSGEA